jgi:hypothetical protein
VTVSAQGWLGDSDVFDVFNEASIDPPVQSNNGPRLLGTTFGIGAIDAA